MNKTSRQIVLDTETTGLNAREGNRIIEIGCVELVNRKLTGNNFHQYMNPERDSEEGALAVHGLTTEFLSDKPKFADIAQQFCEYVRGAEVVIHNAPFDVGFLNAEFTRLGLAPFQELVGRVTDTLVQAKELHPGKRNSLDALCDRYEVSNAHRKLHGALLDAELLADVFLAMSRGQNSFAIDIVDEPVASLSDAPEIALPLGDLLVLPASEEELLLHEGVLGALDKQLRQPCIWRGI
ncbi:MULTISPECIES: DNA polymerase III subunit epsilon [unclassified Undibacterium]|uniref:DNA polymerase III subunit epsilon n=1 Tax=unclassified Undibacterium TaxID=2630295 RepID=UPI002AC89A02|nr:MULTISPECIES: DNA polymerase III subunit epsilon [unclassified Undibacterium]MEB0138732.1 DNA polymerase III subunit epsilon [Undibacterium sp. CCC2.1]MEB0171533.1 DNA polymerase III subunit epsilon [Undibacterium sp. CCC1.1]MEB0175396.1 DNA polymerase III subunit epsilon [Undibacterium sp. CCC3.4]MEB0214733.1 DNA polymerase III subunit epsilon [Undibacterium sp. 5I2]WPX43309.1 DNA polymerase III subunit epsilon [Undibacterium sp. CCC3.4]